MKRWGSAQIWTLDFSAFSSARQLPSTLCEKRAGRQMRHLKLTGEKLAGAAVQAGLFLLLFVRLPVGVRLHFFLTDGLLPLLLKLFVRGAHLGHALQPVRLGVVLFVPAEHELSQFDRWRGWTAMPW